MSYFDDSLHKHVCPASVFWRGAALCTRCHGSEELQQVNVNFITNTCDFYFNKPQFIMQFTKSMPVRNYQLIHLCLDGGRKPRRPEETHTDAGEICQFHPESLEPGPIKLT